MTKAKGFADKNLSNVADSLAAETVNSHQAQQQQQDKNDRRHKDALNHDQPASIGNQHS